ncbi:MAG: right-handed parallel beta-helix repeat-containing protein, partial [Candidatus Kariarchaeaceae archaeon]
NTLSYNNIHDNWDDGVVIEESDWNRLEENDISGNWNGIHVQRTSSENRIVRNSVHHNWGSGIQVDSYSEVFMRSFEQIEATDVDNIIWQASWYEGPSEPPIDYVWKNLQVILTLDGGDPVDVWFSDIYWDEELQAPRFDMDSYFNPLPVGEHFFDVEFILDDISYGAVTGIVVVYPATDDNYAFHNILAVNQIFENSMGVGLNHARNTRIVANDIFDNYGDGINLWGASHSEILYNGIWNNMNMGVRVSKDYDSHFLSEYNTIESNNIFGNWEIGVDVENSNNNLITENEIFGNWWNGIQLQGTSSENTISENDVYQNGDTGIVIESRNEVFFRFRQHIEATDADHITWEASWVWEPEEPPIEYTWENLQVILTINDGEPVEVWFSDIYWDEERQAPRFDMYYWSNPLPVGIYFFNVQFILDDIFYEFTGSVTVVPATDDDFASHNTISHNTVYENSYGIRLFRSIKNDILENHAFSNFGTGIRLEESSENVIQGNDVQGSGAVGIALFSSNNNLITMNDAFESSRSGIFLLGSDLNQISENTLYSNERGISISWDSQENTVTDNLVYENMQVGIEIENSNNNWVLQNEVFNNWWNGIQVFGTSSYNTVSENTVYQNSDSGIVVESSYNEFFVNFGEDAVVTEADNIHWQVSVGDPDYETAWNHYMTFEVSLFIDGMGPVEVWFSGLYWDDGWGAWRFDVDYWSEPLPVGDHEFTVEFFFNGAYHGPFTNIITVIPATEDSYASNNVIQGNNVFDNRLGIRLFNSPLNTISDNIIHQNYEAGIRLEESSENLMVWNEVFSNSWGGIEIMFSSNDNNISWNTAYDNGLSGIFAMESSSNVISENT